MEIDVPPCSVCGQQFDDVFEATDHLLEEGEEPFDPKLILPNGYSLMIGSLLRCLFKHANDPEEISSITQSTYATLYAAETDPGAMKEMIEDIVVDNHMANIDIELKQLIDSETNEEEGK